MSVKLRMTRMGRRHRPFFRINAIESRAPRDGQIIEKLGHYDPIEKDPAKQVVLDHERVKYWLNNGAIPSDTVSEILLREGIKHKYAEQKAARRAKARAIAGKKGRLFNKTQKIAAQKQAEAEAEKAKAEADAAEKAKAEAEAAKKAKAEAQAAEKAKVEAEAAEKAKAKEAEAAEKAKAEAEAAEKAKAEAEAAEKAKAKEAEAAEKTKAEAEPVAKAETEAETSEETDTDSKEKSEGR